ncbi:hypothetical protein LD85_0640 [Saccharolobus islandicus L.D.8.5]|uniref:Uncharacterized protein n=1 Tax=Saccharolobus islandicus (strain L.D.8.5 / Lassen \|nr:hypothetical protein LD85_0640 [Sulfolobus islandicus L.D.8.5]
MIINEYKKISINVRKDSALNIVEKKAQNIRRYVISIL